MCDQTLRTGTLCISAISFWEAALLQARARINLPVGTLKWRQEILRVGLKEISIDGEIGIAATTLEKLHADPADRIIVASAVQLGATLVTADRRILEWSGLLTRHDART